MPSNEGIYNKNNRQQTKQQMGIRKFLGPLNKNNPILVQVLGVCSALAVTAQLKPAVVMTISVIVVCGAANFIISLIRNTIPPRIRIIVQLIVIASLVILVDQFLQAFFYEMSKMLSIFVGLIITNCIIMGRLEAYAMSHKPLSSFIDGIANGAGYGIVLVVVGFFRELLGSGSLWSHQVIPSSLYAAGYLDNGFMILPPMALIIVGTIIWIQKSIYTQI